MRAGIAAARALAGGVGRLLAGLVAVSRVATRAHLPSEAWAGFALGAGVAWFGLWVLRGASLPLRREALGVAALLGLMWWGGSNLNRALPTEQWFRQLATALSGREKPYTRHQWLRQGQENQGAASRRKATHGLFLSGVGAQSALANTSSSVLASTKLSSHCSNSAERAWRTRSVMAWPNGPKRRVSRRSKTVASPS